MKDLKLIDIDNYIHGMHIGFGQIRLLILCLLMVIVSLLFALIEYAHSQDYFIFLLTGALSLLSIVNYFYKKYREYKLSEKKVFMFLGNYNEKYKEILKDTFYEVQNKEYLIERNTLLMIKTTFDKKVEEYHINCRKETLYVDSIIKAAK
jgi:cell shape-determining protein MreC